MDIAFVSTGYYPRHSGGASISTRLITDELRSDGHDVDVYTTTGTARDCVQVDTNLYEIHQGDNYWLPKRIGKNYAAARYLVDLDQYDIVHVYGLGTAPGVVLQCPVPVLGTVNNLEWVCINWIGYLEANCPDYGLREAITLAYRDGYGPLAPLKITIEETFKRIVKSLDHFTVQTEGMKTILTRCGYDESSLTVVPNLLDERFLTEPQDTKNTIISVGRLIEKKGVDDIVRVFSELPSDIRDRWELDLYGDGPLTETIEELQSRTGASIDIGYVPYEELPSVYRDASLMIQGSKYPEPFSRTWLEAMASETPILCSRNPSSETTLEGIAEFYDPFSRSSLHRSLEEILTAPEKRNEMATMGKSAIPDYEPERVVSRYISLYRELT